MTGDTVRSYAEAVVTWLRYLDDAKIELVDVTEEDLGLYRNHLIAPSPGEKSSKSPITANHRLVVAAELHRWGERSGEIRSPLGRHLVNHPAPKRGHSDIASYRRSSESYLAAVDKRLPRVLTQEEILRLFQIARMPYRLMFRWCLTTGLRRSEICSLTLKHLPTPEQLGVAVGQLVTLELLRKGSRLHTVVVPPNLVEETRWYALMERPVAVRRDAELIFLGSRGAPISRASLTRHFRECADHIGSRATLHHLRHTFAVHVLHVLDCFAARGNPMNSLKTLQVMMGHASVETTEVYLQAMSVCSDAVREALDYLYGGPCAKASELRVCWQRSQDHLLRQHRRSPLGF
ncbi:tyrosine-type recombinase/integrase [Cupriavidus campinensis]|uniref:tyrosine-type recombinase/integrase n=1 Tax=Cupriavidus campinensis TaxID=151783 RepID=UPI00292A41E7|nr:site-specific integrase [Cupriavidus campinensis]